jgi:acyl-CoA reductase-like NAD-dependent aldehyde dehydrogenase
MGEDEMANVRLHNPFTQKLVFDEPSATFADIKEKIGKAQSAYKAWRKVPAIQRAAMLRSALDVMRHAQDNISTAIANEMGKTKMAASQEMDFMLERANRMCTFVEDGALVDLDLSRYYDDTFEGTIRYQGKGVIYIISPWNYPLFTAINGVICALLSGSTVVLKHTTTPSVGRLFEKTFRNMGDHRDLLFNVTVDYDVSAEIIEKGDINHVVFTGSVQGGRVIQQSLAKRVMNETLPSPFIEASLELGSNDACYIAEDADMEQALLWAVKIGRLHNSGQSCCAVKRVYVHRSLHDEFTRKAKAIMEKEICGDPMDDATTLGPLFGGKRAVELLLNMAVDARDKGALIVTGGDTQTINGCEFLSPTLVCNVDHSMKIMREETFGPVLPVQKVDDDAQAFELMADTKYGLTASIFTRSRKRVEKFVDALDFGTLFVNRCNFVDARLAWTGFRQSGNGSVALSPEGLRAFSKKKSLNVDGSMLTT